MCESDEDRLKRLREEVQVLENENLALKKESDARGSQWFSEWKMVGMYLSLEKAARYYGLNAEIARLESVLRGNVRERVALKRLLRQRGVLFDVDAPAHVLQTLVDTTGGSDARLCRQDHSE